MGSKPRDWLKALGLIPTDGRGCHGDDELSISILSECVRVERSDTLACDVAMCLVYTHRLCHISTISALNHMCHVNVLTETSPLTCLNQQQRIDLAGISNHKLAIFSLYLSFSSVHMSVFCFLIRSTDQ